MILENKNVFKLIWSFLFGNYRVKKLTQVTPRWVHMKWFAIVFKCFKSLEIIINFIYVIYSLTKRLLMCCIFFWYICWYRRYIGLLMGILPCEKCNKQQNVNKINFVTNLFSLFLPFLIIFVFRCNTSFETFF